MRMRESLVALAMLVCFLCAFGTSSTLPVRAESVPDGSGPFVDELVFKTVWNDDEKVYALLNDEADVVGDMIHPTFLDTLQSSQDIGIMTTPRNGYGYMTINCDKYPLNITAFRRAMAFALDKQGISDNVWDGLSEPLDAVVPKINPFTIEGQLTFSYYNPNPSKGNQLLDAAGFLDVDGDGYREAPDGTDFSVEVVSADASSIAMQIGDYGAGALQSLGIDAISVPKDYFTFIQTLYHHGDYDIAFLGSTFDDLDVDWLAYEFWSEYADEPYFNFPNFRNATYDSWRNQLLHSADYQDVYDAAIEMQRILAYECPLIIAYENNVISAYRTDRFEGHVNDFADGAASWWTNQRVHLKESLGGPYGGSFRWALPLDRDNFNLLISLSVYDSSLKQELYDGVLKRTPDGELIPWLAESYVAETYWDNPAVPEGHTRFKFNFVTNASWSDGMPLTAQDAAFTINYYFEHGLVGGEFLQEGLYAAYAPTDYQLVVEFVGESYWHLTSLGKLEVLPKHQLAGVDPYTWSPSWDELVTSGPFRLAERVPGEFIRMEKNSLYFKTPLTGETTSSSPSDSPAVYSTDVSLQGFEAASSETLKPPDQKYDAVLQEYLETEEIPDSVVKTACGDSNVIVYVSSEDIAEALEEEFGVKWKMNLGPAVVVHASISSARELRRLGENEGVLYVKADIVENRADSLDTTASKGLNSLETRDLIGANGIYASGYNGSGVTVGVVDSGTDFSHPDLQTAMSVDEYGRPTSYDPTGWGIQLMVRANSSVLVDPDAWLAEGNVLTYQSGGNYYINTTGWDPIVNNQGRNSISHGSSSAIRKRVSRGNRFRFHWSL